MKLLLTLFIFFSSKIFAFDYRECFEVELKKDEKKSFVIKYQNQKRDFDFRWTLYKNGGLVIHKKYDRFVSQHMLYLRDKNRSFKVELKTRGEGYLELPYLAVMFKEFKEDKAIFKIMLYDIKEQIYIENIDKKELKRCKE
ncbi:MAG: hypothetical protein RBS91_05930 [Sulfurimonadaceae bacterium]|nr:hypothetical protein [Sulfurimonadaceae bacterium]